MEYARSLRMLKAGWTTATHTAYFQWFLKAASNYRGGASFDKFIEFIRNDAVASLSEAEKVDLQRRAGPEAGAKVTASKGWPALARPARRKRDGRSMSWPLAAAGRLEAPELRERPQDVRRRGLLHLPPLRQ